MRSRRLFLTSALASLLVLPNDATPQEPESMGGFIFGSRNLAVENPNFPGTNYTMVQHVDSQAGYDAIQYDGARGWGFEVINQGAAGRNTAERFGPFDNSTNNRNEFADTLPDELYDSFIGFKGFANTCDETVTGGDPNLPCWLAGTVAAEGGIFRIDVPNGNYRFLGVFGSPDNVHGHHVLIENGGSGPPTNIGDFLPLVWNHDQAQFDTGLTDGEPGDGVFARVGFDSILPPEPQADGPVPVFVDMDASGMSTDNGPDSPTLEVTEGYVRLHLLQGNSNTGDGGSVADAGGDVVLFEAWKLPDTPGNLGDFNGDSLWNTVDIDLLGKEIIAGTNAVMLDMNGDDAVDLADQDEWRQVAAIQNGFTTAYLEGDANLDGKVDAGDLNILAINWQSSPDPWSRGDFNASGFVDAADLNLLGLNWQGSIPNGAAAVPEPNSLAVLCFGLMTSLLGRRKANRLLR